MRITLARLHLYGWSDSDPDFAVFAEHWPDGMEVTLDELYRAADIGFDLTWLAYRVLDRAALYVFEMGGNAREARHAEDEVMEPAARAHSPALYGGKFIPPEQMQEPDRLFEEAYRKARAAYHRARVPDLWKALGGEKL